MGLYDRDYTQADFHSQGHYTPRMRFSLPRLTPVVKWLLISNISIYLAVIFITPISNFVYNWFQIDPSSIFTIAQLWRLITYQFLHDPYSSLHIIFNMLGLYFLGPTLERYMGSRKFLPFYLGCGVAGGLFYILLASTNVLAQMPMVGASGAILGMLAACAILFPHFMVFIAFFPVPIRLAAVLFTGIYLINVLRNGSNAGGDACHLAGMAAGAAYVLSENWRHQLSFKLHRGNWKKKIVSEYELQLELDRILDKVHHSGLQSLTRKEKKILKQATRYEQLKNRY